MITDYTCGECYRRYDTLEAFWDHRTKAHGWQKIGERNWFRYYDGRPGLEQRIAALEEQVRALTLEIAALNADPETVNFGSFRKDG